MAPRAPSLRGLDDPDDLARFLDLRAERDRIDGELAALGPVILRALEDEDDGRFCARGLTLEARVRRSYAYSEEERETAQYLSDLRAAERARGLATVTAATGYVRVTKTPAVEADRLRASAAEAVTAARAAA